VPGGVKTSDNDLRRQLKTERQKQGRFDAKLRSICADTTLTAIEVRAQVMILWDKFAAKVRSDRRFSCKHIDPREVSL